MTQSIENKIVEEVKDVNKEIGLEKNNSIDNAQEINWKKFREQREIERKEREFANKRAEEKAAEAEALKAAMASILNRQSNESVDSTNKLTSDHEETEEQRISRKVKEAIDEQDRVRAREMAEREQRDLPNRLASIYSDFNQVCSTDNLDYLEYHYPEVAAAFKHSPEGFEKWSSVYKAVKRFVPNTDSKKDQNKADKNLNKPQSMAIPGVTQTGDTAPRNLDDKKRADNWARMQKVMKGA